MAEPTIGSAEYQIYGNTR